jgi:hypothetical protein
MPGNNDFQAVATAGAANVLTQAQYLALQATLIADGFQTGLANSQQMNKVLRQATMGCAALGAFISNEGFNANDDGVPANLATALQNAITALIGAVVSIPSTTRMLFQQTAAPSGWTKDATINDRALRVVSGSVTQGGSVAFSATFSGNAHATSAYTLQIADMPNHTHVVIDPTHAHTIGIQLAGGVGSGAINMGFAGSSATSAASTGITIQSAGGGGAHSHNWSSDLMYCDTIVCQKN